MALEFFQWTSGAVFRTANVTGSSFLHASALVGIALRGWGCASGICIWGAKKDSRVLFM